MRLALLISLVWAAVTVGLEGPDLMLLGDQYLPDDNSFNLIRPPESTSCIEATARHGFLYGLKSLNWTYVASKCNFKSYSAAIGFRSYGIEEIYMSSWYFLSIQKSIIRDFSLGLGYCHSETIYGDNLLKTVEDFISVNVGAKFGDFAAAALASGKSLNKKNDGYNKPEYIAACSWQADSSLSVSCLLFNDKRDHQRLMISQNLAVYRSLNIVTGIISAPEVYYAGLEIVYKRFVFGYTFYAVGGLDDCSKLSISYW